MTHRKRPEREPPAIGANGSLFVILLVDAFFLWMPWVGGQAIRDVAWTITGALTGSSLAVAYFMWKPLNLFSNNAYAPKPLSSLTSGELKALAFLNSSAGRFAVLKYIAQVPVAAVFGAMLSTMGYVLIVEDPPTPVELNRNLFAYVLPMVLVSFLTSSVMYFAAVARAVRTHWDWILEHQPLPSAKVLAKYAGRKEEVGPWDHLYGTEFPEELNRALEGRPGRGFWRVMLQLLGGGAAALVLFRLISGGVVEERRVGAFIILAGGLLVYWLAGKYLRTADSDDDR